VELGTPRIRPRGDQVRYEVLVTSAGGPERLLWYSVGSDFAHLISSQADAAAVALMVPAMRRGEELKVCGPLSPEIAFHLSGDWQALMREVIPSLSPIRVEASEIAEGPRTPSGAVATGFSGGIDSFAVIADHRDSNIPGWRLNHLLYNNVGSHGRGGVDLFRSRTRKLAPTARQLGLPFVAVDSNLSDFFSEAFVRTHTVRNASVALLLQGGLTRYLYASAYSYQQILLTAPSKLPSAYTDPIMLPQLSTASIRLVSCGSQYSRAEKTMRVADLPESYTALDVCIDSATEENCSACWKCMRTMLTLEIGGKLDRYDQVFDLSTYRQGRLRWMAEVLASAEPLNREIVAFAEDRDFTFPQAARARVPTAYLIPRLRRGAARAVPSRLRPLAKRALRMRALEERSGPPLPNA
jgi:hypothetical protein